MTTEKKIWKINHNLSAWWYILIYENGSIKHELSFCFQFLYLYWKIYSFPNTICDVLILKMNVSNKKIFMYYIFSRERKCFDQGSFQKINWSNDLKNVFILFSEFVIIRKLYNTSFPYIIEKFLIWKFLFVSSSIIPFNTIDCDIIVT